MATYVYHCQDCGHTFEREMTLREHAEKPKVECPKCESTHVEAVPSAVQTVTSSKG